MEGVNLPTHSPSNPDPVLREVECPECVELAHAPIDEKVSTIDAFKASFREKIGTLANHQFKVVQMAGTGIAAGVLSIFLSPTVCPRDNDDGYANCVVRMAAIGAAVALASLGALALYGLDAAAEKQEAQNTLTEEALRLHSLCIEGDPKYFHERIQGLENDYTALSDADNSLKETSLIPSALIQDVQERGADNGTKAVLLHLAEELLQSAKETKKAYDRQDLDAACALLREKVTALETSLMSLYPPGSKEKGNLPVSQAFEKLVHA